MGLLFIFIVTIVVVDLTITLTGLLSTVIVVYQVTAVDKKLSGHISNQERFIKTTSQ